MSERKSLMLYEEEERPKPALPSAWLPRKLAKARLKDQYEIASLQASIADQVLITVQKRSAADIAYRLHEANLQEQEELIEHRRTIRRIDVQKSNNELLAMIIGNNRERELQIQDEIETQNSRFEYEQKLKGAEKANEPIIIKQS